MRNLLPALLFLIGVGIIYYAYTSRVKPSEFQTMKTPELRSRSLKGATSAPHSHASHGTGTAAATASDTSSPPPILSRSQATSEIAVTHMNSLLKTYVANSYTLNDVIDDLDKRKMEPLLMKDSNPHTGTMYVLRTDSPIPGTRYFHAQYFTDDHKEPFLQHMSFDVKPGATAFQDSIAAIKKVFGKLSAPTVNTKDFIVWPWKKGYNIWVQKMDKDQIVGDPYNAYAANDIGTVKIAVELDTFHGHSH